MNLSGNLMKFYLFGFAIQFSLAVSHFSGNVRKT